MSDMKEQEVARLLADITDNCQSKAKNGKCGSCEGHSRRILAFYTEARKDALTQEDALSVVSTADAFPAFRNAFAPEVLAKLRRVAGGTE